MAGLPLLDVPIGDYGDDEDAIVRYRKEGTERAMALGNRGPVRYGDDGKIHPDILAKYDECGFYIFEGVYRQAERDDIEADVAEMLERCPVTKDAPLDKHGRPALGTDCEGRTVTFVRPLSDPLGGTDANHGRHPAKMIEPDAPDGAPEWIPQTILGMLQFSDACLRAYAHPDMLAVAEAIHGEDFTPFNEAVWVKHPGLGGAVAWHQDGWTHWNSPELNNNSHGFNFMMQLYGCDAANGLWIVPGSHREGRVDIKAMAKAAGSDRLPQAVPAICAPGDVLITNRQALHGSFANTSPNVRVTINFGFHRRQSVLGIESGGVHNPVSVYTDEYIRERSKVIMWGIDARRQRFPDEAAFNYKPFAGEHEHYRFTAEAKAAMKDYNLRDLGI
ncbi:MAG: phytanoyl-CoA dioxygenase family protein [Pseudomonadota bacterium]